MKALIFLIDGFEEIEALVTIDILRRGEVDVKSVSLTGNKDVKGGHDVVVKADVLFEEADFDVDMLILPGGTVALNGHEGLKQKVSDFALAGKRLAAICAAPMVLGGLGLLKGKKATAYPGFEEYLIGAEFCTEAVVQDGSIITGRGPGLSFDFALALLGELKSKEVADEVAGQLLLHELKPQSDL